MPRSRGGLPDRLADAQVDVVLVDDSGSMRSAVPALDARKSAAAARIARLFFAAVALFRPLPVCGLATFSGAAGLALGAGVPVVPEIEPSGQTSIWRALRCVLERLGRAETLRSARKRILLITDGEDVTGDARLPVCRELAESGVVLDAVVLGTTDDEIDCDFQSNVIPFVLNSGGCAFRPRSFEEIAQLVNLEQFADLTCRRGGARRRPEVPGIRHACGGGSAVLALGSAPELCAGRVGSPGAAVLL
jgi:hypothetical protein